MLFSAETNSLRGAAKTRGRGRGMPMGRAQRPPPPALWEYHDGTPPPRRIAGIPRPPPPSPPNLCLTLNGGGGGSWYSRGPRDGSSARGNATTPALWFSRPPSSLLMFVRGSTTFRDPVGVLRGVLEAIAAE